MYVKACMCMPVCLIGSDTIGFVGGRYSNLRVSNFISLFFNCFYLMLFCKSHVHKVVCSV